MIMHQQKLLNIGMERHLDEDGKKLVKITMAILITLLVKEKA